MLQQREVVFAAGSGVAATRSGVAATGSGVAAMRSVVAATGSWVATTRHNERLIYGLKIVPKLQSDSFGIFVLSHPPKLRSAK